MALESELVGRSTEIDLIDGLLDGAPEHGSTLLMVGEPGIGKSALLSVAASHARQRGMGVLSTAGVEAEAHLPFAALHRLLRPVLGEANELPQPQRDALRAGFGQTDAAEPEMFRIALAALHLLAAAAEQRPLLVVVEDAHWLDRSTIDVLAFVARRIDSDPIVLLVAARDDGLGERLPSLRLGGLDEPAARSLLSAHAGELAADAVDRLVETAGGNPLALVELPIAWREAAGKSTLPGWLPLTRRLEHAFVARTSDMPPATRTLLLVAAADEEALLPDLFRAAGTLVGRRVDEAELRPAVAADLVRLDEAHLRFRHPLVRSAIYQTAPFDERHAAHAALADALVAEPDRRAWHRAASTIAPDAQVADELESSAERARRRGGISVAITILERAAHFSDDPGRRGELLLRAAELGFEAGSHDAVDRLVAKAGQLALRPVEQAQLLWLHGVFDEGLGRGDGRVDRLVATAERLVADDNSFLALRLLWNAAVQSWWSDADETARERIASVADRVATEGDLRLLATLAFASPVTRGADLIARLRDAALSVGDTAGGAWVAGMAATAVGMFDLSAQLLAASAVGLRVQGRLGLLSRALTLQAWSAVHRADLRLGITVAEEAERLAGETRQPLIAAVAQASQAMLAALRGDADRAAALAIASEGVAIALKAHALHAAIQHARGLAALGAGAYAEACEHLHRLHDPADPAHHYFIRWLTVADLVEAAVRHEQTAGVASIVAEMQAVATSTPSPIIHAGLAYARALLAPDTAAETRFGEALRLTAGVPFLRARTQLAHGMWLRRQRRLAESRPPLRTARDSLEALGTVPWSERARQELRASGESSRRRTPDARDELSPQELQIAHMAADGLTNREIAERLFLSHRTVSSHLYRLFPKLGITSRAALGKALEAQSFD